MYAADRSVKAERTWLLCKDETFSRSVRLLDAASYGQVFKRNKRLANRYWIILGHKSRSGSEPASLSDLQSNSQSSAGQAKHSRLGMAIAKKRAKRAVDRNRIKRIARESFRQNKHLLQGFDIVVMNKDKAVSASKAELRQSLDALLVELAGKK